MNPTTAMKAITKLADDGVIYKRRGIGMCVSPGARAQIVARRRKAFFDQTIGSLLAEAAVLAITTDELVDEIRSREGRQPC